MRGSKPGERRGGRKKGTPNRASRETREAAQSSGLLPHEFLLAVSRGQHFEGYRPTFEQRIKAATDAAPYFAPKLASVQHAGPDGGAIVVKVMRFARDLPAEQLATPAIPIGRLGSLGEG